MISVFTKNEYFNIFINKYKCLLTHFILYIYNQNRTYNPKTNINNIFIIFFFILIIYK